MDEWYNAVQLQINLAKYPQETARILQRDIFWFFLKDEEFVPRTINDSDIDLDKLPSSKVRQLAKKLESSKSTAKYIKQVSNEPQAIQVNLLRHQCTELPPNKYQRKQKNSSQGQKIMNTSRKREKLTDCYKKMKSSNKNTTIKKKDVTCVMIHPILKVSDVPRVDISARIAVK